MGAVRKALRPQVVALRITGAGVNEIADELGVAHQAISDTLKLPEVQAAVEEAHTEARSKLVSKITSTATEAVDTLVQLMRDESAPAAVRRQAASDLLDRAGIVRGMNVEVQHSVSVQAELRAMLSRLTDEQLDESLGVDTDDDFALLSVLEADDDPDEADG